jgi:hypothetical protein
MPSRLLPLVRLALNQAGRVTSSRVTADVSCAAAPCGGELEIIYRHRVNLKHGKHRLVRTVIGQAAYTVPAGDSGSVRLALNRAGRGFLSAAADHRLAVTVQVSLSGGAATSILTSIHLAAVRTKRK